MSNVESIVSIVKEYFRKYDNFGLIDDDDLYRIAELSIKELGNNATIIYEDVIKIKNGIGTLPNNFYRLQEARTCEPLAYERNNKDYEIHTVMSTEFYNLIHELKTSWNECEDCCKDKEMKVFRKEVVLKENFSVTCNYNKGHRLMLTKGTIKNYCDKMYGNMTPECGHEISIHGRKMDASFSEGDVYIKYKGFPLDENGNIDFEETPNNSIERYIEYALKKDVAERLTALNVQGVSNLLTYFAQEARIYKKKAENELKFNSLNPTQLINRIVLDNQNNYKIYSLRG